MIVDLMKKGIVSKKSLLMSTYKKAGLSENECMIIMMIMHLSADPNLFVTPATLAEVMNLSPEQIDQAIAKLGEKNYLKFIAKKIDFTPLFTRLVGIIEEEYLMQENEDLFQIMNTKLTSPLTNEQKNEITIMINGCISKQQLLKVVNENEFTTYADMTKLIGKTIANKTKSITRFNWLEN